MTRERDMCYDDVSRGAVDFAPTATFIDAGD